MTISSLTQKTRSISALLACTFLLSALPINAQEQTAEEISQEISQELLQEFTQETADQDQTIPHQQTTQDVPKYGHLTYTEFITPQYQDGLLFTEGLAAVKKGGKWGYIDESNKIVIQCEYDDVGPFHQGVAVVANRENNHLVLGFINTAGGYTPLVKFGAHFKISLEGQDTAQNLLGLTQHYHNGFYSFSLPNDPANSVLFNSSGTAVSTSLIDFQPYNENYLVGYHPGYGAIEALNADGTQSSFDMNALAKSSGFANGSIIKGYSPNQGILPVIFAQHGSDHQMLGFVSVSSKSWLIPPKYTNFYYSNPTTTQEFFGESGLAVVSDGQGYGAINKSGDTVVPLHYEMMLPSSFGLMAFQDNGKIGFMNEYGYGVIDAKFEKVSMFSSLGLAVAVENGTAKLINTKGIAVSGGEMLSSALYLPENNGGTLYSPGELILVQRNGLTGYGKLDYRPDLPTENDTSAWALGFVTQSIEADLIPVSLQNRYTANINRQDFAKLAVHAVAEIRGQTVEELVQQETAQSVTAHMATIPFTDCSDSYVILANALGIVSGKKVGIYDPYAAINRQEAAVMLANVAKIAGINVTDSPSTGVSDESDIADWALSSVNFLFQSDIMSTTGNNRFSPSGAYTKEQSFVTILKMANLKA